MGLYWRSGFIYPEPDWILKSLANWAVWNFGQTTHWLYLLFKVALIG
ncbi:conserved protein of unknown function [Limnospira indica PCC 8005]|uniref:Uncharacterized protein n=1 Tax=Limnospira indica PCC 8005 TaxID=376219 RepID=A0A9P1KLR2_9CYAN|nr:conserved protein of unknown function [Limnospira indica PCC 8005]